MLGGQTLDWEDTIVAIASAPGGATRGVVRMSGPKCLAVLSGCFRPGDGKDLSAVTHPTIIAGELDLGAGDALPADLFFWPTTRSYTRQPSAELHTLGSPPLLAAAVGALVQAGARLAGPGEFTLRAFLAGRLDLTQAEAVLGVIDARDERRLHAALEQLAGGLAKPLHALREELIDLLSHLEASLDFVDEDIEFISQAELSRALAVAADRLANIAAQLASRGAENEVVRVVLWGKPNAGKSSLLNALVGAEAALVSPTAGTTRDYLVRRTTIAGREIELCDTAGVTEADDSLAAAAQRMTSTAAERGDLRLICIDRSQPFADELPPPDGPALLVWTKGDLPAAAALETSYPQVTTSASDGSGLAELRSALTRLLETHFAGDSLSATAARSRESLRLATESLARARQLATHGGGEELVAAELRIALDELGQIVGAVYTDDLLDRIFSRFCIGK